jgi:restriction system protein
MEEGDIVLIPTPDRKILIGKVAGPYRFKDWNDECRFAHRRKTEWLKTVDRDDLPEHLKSSLNAHLTVFSVDKHETAIEQMLGRKTTLETREVSGDRLEETVLDKLMSLTPREFEEFISHLLDIVGYETVTTEYVADKGVDVVGVLNAAGLTNVRLKVQVRRVQGTIGIKEVQRMRGTLAVDEHGAIITTSGFSRDAQREAESERMKPISLLDGEMLVDLVLKHYDELDTKYKDLIQLKKRPIALKDQFVISTDKRAGA